MELSVFVIGLDDGHVLWVRVRDRAMEARTILGASPSPERTSAWGGSDFSHYFEFSCSGLWIHCSELEAKDSVFALGNFFSCGKWSPV